ncbi:uncharacterized protein [Apostichopus japonicus]|uniref:uncharacterized protein n=1 Tax=Stichopus japonicus TaxID=307972 RepID=UPI003AB34B23
MHVYIFVGSLYFIHCCLSISPPCTETDYPDESTTAAIGQNVTFECEVDGNCPYFYWFIYLANTSRTNLFERECKNSYKACHEKTYDGRNVLRLTDIDNRVAGYYQCLCASNPPYAFACERLNVVNCQFEVRVNNVLMFNSSNVGPTQTHVINVSEGEYIRVKCPKTSNRHNCPEDSSKMFTATRSHQNCFIECNCSRKGATWVTINVLQRETPTNSSSTTVALHYIASTTSLASYSKEEMTDGNHQQLTACKCIPVVAVLLVSVSILVLVVGALSIYIRYLKTNGFPKPVSTNKAIFSQPVDGTVSTYVNADAGKAATRHTCVPNAEVMVSPMSITDNLEVNCSASKSNDANCDASGYEIPKNMDCTNEIKYETIN